MKTFKLLSLTAIIAVTACLSSCGEAGAAAKREREKTVTEVSETAAISAEEQETEKRYTSRSELLQCEFFDNEKFPIWDANASEYPSDKPIICGTVPHHLTAGGLISGFFKAAAQSRDDVETVVIVATSHYDGLDPYYTTLSDWSTPFGTVETDNEISEYFRSVLRATVDDGRLTADHSASSHIPFVRYYFPNANVACLLVAPSVLSDASHKLADALLSVPNADKCLFLFSIDFSHYLSPDEADRCDGITRNAVNEKDYAKIARFNNDNVDSPVILGAYVRLSELMGKEVTEADNSNSQRILRTPYSPDVYPEGVTSYFVFITA